MMFMLAMAGWLVLGAVVSVSLAAEPPRISKEELRAMLGNPDLVIIDDRTGSDWTASEFKIKGAIREDPNKVETWMDKYPKDKTLVFY
jgi:rhodanese-related sulfurtransferase